MTPNRKCEECGAELPPNAPQGLCPRCLAKMGLDVLPAAEATKGDIQIELTGARIGRYKLLEKIGEGGFGVVFMAEQIEPVHRKVALKIIKAGMDTKEIIARFEAERQAIALMDHPNIARALDAGTTEAGRPYFVMELVRGIPITDYCDQNHLPTRERLALFIKVCQAVQHAHQKGVIHRDLKPGNVLVTEHDGEPVPKVIDFGVAKALGQKLTEKTLFTGFQHMIGTPAYMSPEQAALSGIDVDTRADIYSLGVLLYELLTGVTPFDAETFRKAGLDEIRRMIRETEPPKPSTRLHSLGQQITEVAKQRHTEPATLSKLVRGDLDWIVMKCLEKDRKRRYETVNGLAADVARHMVNEPIVARPPSNVYRFQKLIRRNKLAFAASAAITFVLLAGVAVSAWQAVRATRAERTQARLRLQAEEALARNEVHTAEQLFTLNDYSTALAHLAQVLRQTPTNETIAAKVFSDLTRHNFIVPLTEPLKHNAEVRYAQFSLDGQKVVTASWDGTARVWNAQTGEAITPPLRHEAKVNRAQFDSKGDRVVTASDDKSARIWDTATGEPLVPPIRHEGEVGDACFSPDGRLLFTALSPRAWAAKGLQGNIWESATGKFVTGPFGAGNSLQRVLRPFSPDSRTFVTVTPTTAAICDSSTGGQLVGPLPLDGYGYSSGEFSSNGERMVTCGMTARVWDARTGSLIREVKEDGPIFVAQLSPDGERLLTVSTGLDKTAQVWNATTGRALTGPIKLGWSKTTQFGPNAEWVITAGSGQVRLWKATTGELLTEPIRESGICWGELSADGERLVTCSTEGNARVWGIKMGQQAHLSVSLPVPEWIPEFVESLGGKRLTNTGHTEAVPLDQIFRLKSKLAQNLESNSWTLWAKWLLQLTVSPTASSGSANTTEIGKQEVANLLTNGSFELPVYAGDGDVVPSATEFGLPGWTFSPGAGVQHLILEYGKPYGRARYAEGRQAVLLNGDGCKPPIMLSQTFPTAPGHDYVLSFTQGDEEMAGPSNSELTVSVGGVRRVFSRTNDTGMVIKILHFKATSNLTTLTFEDTTPNVPDVFHSPFLDDVSVIQHETNGSTSTRR